MKPNPGLDDLLAHGAEKGIFGTKMRSFIKLANPAGIEAIVAQQFQVGRQILDKGLLPIVEPEVDINSPEKVEAESLLRDAIATHLDDLSDGQQVILKLTLPSEDNFYRPFVDDPQVLRVVALSGGYSRKESNDKLSRNNGMIASFSRSLAEGLSRSQSDEELKVALASSIDSILAASRT